MPIIKEDYVSFETAKLLKEKGFDWECEYFYDWYEDDDEYIICSIGGSCNKEDYPSEYSMPTLQMTCKWLREVHKIYIDIDIRIILEQWAGYNVTIYKTNIDNCLLGKFISLKGLKDNTSYEEACEVAIKYCIENLI